MFLRYLHICQIEVWRKKRGEICLKSGVRVKPTPNSSEPDLGCNPVPSGQDTMRWAACAPSLSSRSTGLDP